MIGLPELVEEIVGGPVRIGYPYGIAGLPAELRKPTFSAAVGLLLWGIKHQDNVHEMNHSSPEGNQDKAMAVRGSEAA